jgi:hypothetical protein
VVTSTTPTLLYLREDVLGWLLAYHTYCEAEERLFPGAAHFIVLGTSLARAPVCAWKQYLGC